MSVIVESWPIIAIGAGLLLGLVLLMDVSDDIDDDPEE